MSINLKRRVEQLETEVETDEAVVLLVYRDQQELESMQAGTAAKVQLAIPDNGRDRHHDQS